jgi:hypothetical protein
MRIINGMEGAPMSFRVIPSTVPMLTDDWLKAKNAASSELPNLNEEQMADARELSIPEEDYRRFRVLLRANVLERQSREGKAFGDFVLKLIEPLGNRYTLATVSRRGTPLGWRIVIRDEVKGSFEFQSPFEVVEALTSGHASHEDVESFRSDLFHELGQTAMLGVAG